MPIAEIDAASLRTLLASSESEARPLLIDVRGFSERIDGHIPDDVHLPLDELAERLDELPPAPSGIVVYCAHGIRSRAAVALLAGAGHAHARSLRGGFEAWQALASSM